MLVCLFSRVYPKSHLIKRACGLPVSSRVGFLRVFIMTSAAGIGVIRGSGYCRSAARVQCPQHPTSRAVHSWFPLWPSRSPGPVDIFYANEWLWYFLHGMLNDGTGWWPPPPPPPTPCSLRFLCFSICLTDPPFLIVVWIWLKSRLAQLYAEL